MIPTYLRRALGAALLLTAAACSSDPTQPPPTNPFRPGKSERELRLEADGLYRLARRSLDTSDFAGALQRYQQILLRFPFTDYATQAELESIYAKYRNFDPDGALSTADRFLKEHPRHPAVDYVYYLKGLINFQRGDSLFDWLADSSRQDVSYARRAFDDFALLIQRYPNSRFAGDARLRMVHLRNRIATHELSIVKYYVRRGAHIAAAKRAEKVIAEYPGAPATLEALALLEDSYRAVGLTAQADEVRRVRAANPDAFRAAAPGTAKPGGSKSFWQRWFGAPVDPIREPEAAPAASATLDEFMLRPGAVVREIRNPPGPYETAPAGTD